MKKVIVIGGGLAGLSCAYYLSKAGYTVKVLEASPKIGGRAYSFDYNGKDKIDNGQHVLMGSCKYALNYLKEIGTFNKVLKQKKLAMTLRERNGKENIINAKGNIYPFNLVFGILNYKALSMSNRFRILFFLAKLKFINPRKLETLSAREWLSKMNDSGEMFDSFWDIIINAIMNTSSERASASTLAFLLQEIFLKGNQAATMLIPGTDLSDLFFNNAMELILKNNGTINLSERILKIEFGDSLVTRMHSTSGTYDEFDSVVMAVPFHALKNISIDNPPPFMDQEFKYSPIVTVHIWLQKNPFKQKYYGLINSRMHWLFNHDRYVTTVTSCAEDLVGLGADEISTIAIGELKEYFPEFSESLITSVKVIKEKRATFIPDAVTELQRKNIPASFGNLYFAGDWTNTGLPGTIEGAIKSGKIAAELIISKN